MRVSQFRSPGVKFRPKPKLCLGFATVTETEAETALRAVSAPKPKPNLVGLYFQPTMTLEKTAKYS